MGLLLNPTRFPQYNSNEIKKCGFWINIFPLVLMLFRDYFND